MGGWPSSVHQLLFKFRKMLGMDFSQAPWISSHQGEGSHCPPIIPVPGRSLHNGLTLILILLTCVLGPQKKGYERFAPPEKNPKVISVEKKLLHQGSCVIFAFKDRGLSQSLETTLKNWRNPASPRDNTCQSLGLIFPCNKVLMVDPEDQLYQCQVSDMEILQSSHSYLHNMTFWNQLFFGTSINPNNALLQWKSMEIRQNYGTFAVFDPRKMDHLMTSQRFRTASVFHLRKSASSFRWWVITT